MTDPFEREERWQAYRKRLDRLYAEGAPKTETGHRELAMDELEWGAGWDNVPPGSVLYSGMP